jgi:hypothetical protein
MIMIHNAQMLMKEHLFFNSFLLVFYVSMLLPLEAFLFILSWHEHIATSTLYDLVFNPRSIITCGYKNNNDNNNILLCAIIANTMNHGEQGMHTNKYKCRGKQCTYGRCSLMTNHAVLMNLLHNYIWSNFSHKIFKNSETQLSWRFLDHYRSF